MGVGSWGSISVKLTDTVVRALRFCGKPIVRSIQYDSASVSSIFEMRSCLYRYEAVSRRSVLGKRHVGLTL